jgi:GxxExxY protein
MLQSENLETLTEVVIGCAIAVHTELGPGLLESIYRKCLAIELTSNHLSVRQDQRVAIEYRGRPVDGYLILDMVVEGSVVIEVKAVERLLPIHLAQVITYLKLTGYPIGLLMNFNSTSLRSGLRRLVHPDKYVPRRAQE